MDDSLMDEIEGRDRDDDHGPRGSIVTPRGESGDDVWAELTAGEESDAGSPQRPRDKRATSLSERVFGRGIEMPSFLRRTSAPDRPGDGAGRGAAEPPETRRLSIDLGDLRKKSAGYSSVGMADLESGEPSPLAADELLDGTEMGQWAAVSNLDEFFTRFYNYYRNGGIVAMLLQRISNLLVLAFTVVFSTFLFVLVDWQALFSCSDAADGESCHDLSRYIKSEAIPFEDLTTYHFIVIVYFVLFSFYWAVSALAFFPFAVGAWRMHSFYRDRLNISTRELQTMHWHEVVSRFESLHRSGSYRVALKEVTAHEIAMRIMRKDNYMVAMVNKDMLDLSLPVPFTKMRLHTPLTKSLEWNLDITLFSHMWGRNFLLRRSFVDNVGSLQRRFVLVGIVNFLLLPFALMFLIVYFFLKHAEDFHKKGDYLGPRKWSPEALWRFREFNELPHVFERRINASFSPANDFQKQFPFPELAALARCIAYIAGALVSALLLLTVVDENLLLFIHFGDRNLLWYIAMLSAILAIARSFVPTPEDRVFNPNGVMRKMVAFTHYMPRHWRGRCHTYDVRDEFLEMFQYRILLFLQDIMSVLFTPLLLCFVLPFRAERLLQFIRRVSTDVEGTGTVCGYAMFDVNKYGNANYGAPLHASKLLRSKQGKMEKSLVNFMTNHPNWEARPELQNLLARLDDFQFEEAAQLIMEPAAAAADGTSSRGDAKGSAVLRPVILSSSGERVPNSSSGHLMSPTDGGARLRHSGLLLSPGFSSSERIPVLASDSHASQGRFFWLDVFYESQTRTGASSVRDDCSSQ